MAHSLHLEPLLATGYAILLLGIAACLEWMGRHSHRRVGRYHNAGFRFHAHADHWECPTGTLLERAEADYQLHVIRYRAPAYTCNSCAIKTRCTDSDTGREIAVSLDPWLASAIGRFHRGMSLVFVVLAGMIVFVELLRHDHGIERWILSATLLPMALLGSRLLKDIRHPVQV
jgi:hypothetical protein